MQLARTDTVVAHPGWVRPSLWLGLPALGAGAGWLLIRGVGWLVALPWAPLPGPLRLLDSAPEPLATVVAVLLGVAAGVGIAHQAGNELLAVSVSPAQLRLSRAGTTTQLARADVTDVFLAEKQLVVLGPAGQELARQPCDLSPDALRAAFTRHGYRWHPDGDPYRDHYRRWVPGTPGLPPGAAPLLRARQRALTDKDRQEAADLRRELSTLGVVVRDEQTRQYWRLTGG